MTYLGYVAAAYGVFAVVMLWEFLAPRWQVRAQLRAAKLRAKRGESTRQADRSPTPTAGRAP